MNIEAVRAKLSAFFANGRAYNTYGTFNPLYWVIIFRRKSQYINAGNVACQYLAQGNVLDVGCGSGFALFHLARSAPGVICTGVDISPILIGDATNRAVKLGCSERVSFIQADVRSLPFEKDCFDIVISMFSLHQWPDHVTGLKEIYRVLKPGARLFIQVGGNRLKIKGNSMFFIKRKPSQYLKDVMEQAGFSSIVIRELQLDKMLLEVSAKK